MKILPSVRYKVVLPLKCYSKDVPENKVLKMSKGIYVLLLFCILLVISIAIIWNVIKKQKALICEMKVTKSLTFNIEKKVFIGSLFTTTASNLLLQIFWKLKIPWDYELP